jgi:hypothetical protein
VRMKLPQLRAMTAARFAEAQEVNPPRVQTPTAFRAYKRPRNYYPLQ